MLLIRRLEFWTTDWIRIDLETQRITEQLAACGVDPPGAGAGIGPWDSLEIARMKEALLSLENARERIRRGLASFDAVLVDTATMEILLPGGPGEDTFLSWQPGENGFCFFRADPGSRRQPMPSTGVETAGVTFH